MKTHEIKNVLVNKTLDDAFNILYATDNSTILSHMSSIVKWEQFPPETKKGIIQQKDILTLKTDKIPESYRNLLEDASTYLRVQMIKKLIHKTDNKYTIRIKYKVLNLKHIANAIVNKLQLITLKCKIHLHKHDENTTKVCMKMKASAFVPHASEIEEYTLGYSKQMMNTILSIMQK